MTDNHMEVFVCHVLSLCFSVMFSFRVCTFPTRNHHSVIFLLEVSNSPPRFPWFLFTIRRTCLVRQSLRCLPCTPPWTQQGQRHDCSVRVGPEMSQTSLLHSDSNNEDSWTSQRRWSRGGQNENADGWERRHARTTPCQHSSTASVGPKPFKN